MGKTARELIEEAACAQDLNMELAATTMMRIAMLKFLETPDEVSVGALGDVLTGAGAILKSKPADTETSLDKLQEFISGVK